MSRRFTGSTLVAAALAAAMVSVPATASAQQLDYIFRSCSTAGICGFVETIFQGSLLTVRLSNTDNSFGSQLFDAQLVFATAVNPSGPLGGVFEADANGVATHAPTIGTVGAWNFNTTFESTILDLTTFTNSYLEGGAASGNRPLPGDPDQGIWLTQHGFVEFTTDVSTLSGVNAANLTALQFCTDQGCAIGDPVATPEPATIGLVATGLLGLVVVRRRRKATTA